MANPRKPGRQAPPQDSGPQKITHVDFSEVRTGEDTRQRGWFWHWNELHTEYEPLLKHSGIGLITSYIVWTDRREHSPYRGYAFPSLQSQAAFSGSDRAELMTINRILVALDLIEIRKEMVLRVDAQGHKWRVPHNLYRVKDRSGDPHLTAQDVLAVLALAEKRKDVYRHVRHILTSSFVPISRNNIWHQILAEIQFTPLWQRLAARATAEEARFSARSKADHAARKPAPAVAVETRTSAPEEADHVSTETDPEADFFIPGTDPDASTAPVITVQGSATIGAASNQGFQTSVAKSNHGLDEARRSSGAGSNQGRGTTVAPSNPMYDQSIQATRTNTEGGNQGPVEPVTSTSEVVTTAVTTIGQGLSQVGSGPGTGAAPGHGPDRAAALIAFAEANGRVPSAAEERLLGRIAAEGDTANGWAMVTAGIYEAVDSGSAFVAPKRVREIVRRWLRDGLPAELAAELSGAVAEDDGAISQTELVRPAHADSGDVAHPFWIAEAGIGSAQLWAAVIDLVAQEGAMRPSEIHDYLKPAVLLERTGATSLRLGVAHELARQRIEHRWRTALEDAIARLVGGAGWELDIQVIGEAGQRSA
jgi:hypothetical protein